MKEVYANEFPLSIVNICFCLPVVGSHNLQTTRYLVIVFPTKGPSFFP